MVENNLHNNRGFRFMTGQVHWVNFAKKFKCNRKFAFTLAEVLITIGIIGVVAAMTIPVLIQKYQVEVTVNKVKKTYSMLAQVMQLAQTEYGNYYSWGENEINKESTRIVSENILPFLKISTNCGQTSERNDCVINKSYMRLSGVRHDTNYNNSIYYKVILQDGSFLWWRAGTSQEGIVFFVDINGSKSPNTIGKDLFCFCLDENGVLRPGYIWRNNNVSYNSIVENRLLTDCKGKNSSGLSCAYWIIKYENMDYLK